MCIDRRTGSRRRSTIASCFALGRVSAMNFEESVGKWTLKNKINRRHKRTRTIHKINSRHKINRRHKLSTLTIDDWHILDNSQLSTQLQRDYNFSSLMFRRSTSSSLGGRSSLGGMVVCNSQQNKRTKTHNKTFCEWVPSGKHEDLEKAYVVHNFHTRLRSI